MKRPACCHEQAFAARMRADNEVLRRRNGIPDSKIRFFSFIRVGSSLPAYTVFDQREVLTGVTENGLGHTVQLVTEFLGYVPLSVLRLNWGHGNSFSAMVLDCVSEADVTPELQFMVRIWWNVPSYI